MADESPKVEFFANNGIIEIRYFDGSTALTINPEHSRRIDTPKDQLYRSWKLPEIIADELIAWWAMLKKNKGAVFPLQKRTKVCEFTMHTEKYIEIKSLDCLGRTNMTSWSLPVVVVEHLVIWQKDANDR